MNWRIGLIGCALAAGGCVNATPGPARTPMLWPLPSATALPAKTSPARPVIIASPTPPPTPVTHVVQKGDTLIGLAVKYGVSVEALQQANNNVQPQFLSIGMVLVIPLSEEALQRVQAAGLSGATPTPIPVPLSTPACYPLATGALYCFVEVRNTSETALENVAARVVLAGPDGLPLASAVASAAVDVVRPGQSAALAALFASPPDEIAARGADLIAALPLADVNSRYVPLEVADHHGTATGLVWTATGMVHNPSTTPASTARLVLTLYDQANVVLGFQQVMLEGGLAAGESRDFTITAASLGGPAARYTLVAEGQP
jgi:LysM repeat protein